MECSPINSRSINAQVDNSLLHASLSNVQKSPSLTLEQYTKALLGIDVCELQEYNFQDSLSSIVVWRDFRNEPHPPPSQQSTSGNPSIKNHIPLISEMAVPLLPFRKPQFSFTSQDCSETHLETEYTPNRDDGEVCWGLAQGVKHSFLLPSCIRNVVLPLNERIRVHRVVDFFSFAHWDSIRGFIEIWCRDRSEAERAERYIILMCLAHVKKFDPRDDFTRDLIDSFEDEMYVMDVPRSKVDKNLLIRSFPYNECVQVEIRTNTLIILHNAVFHCFSKNKTDRLRFKSWVCSKVETRSPGFTMENFGLGVWDEATGFGIELVNVPKCKLACVIGRGGVTKMRVMSASDSFVILLANDQVALIGDAFQRCRAKRAIEEILCEAGYTGQSENGEELVFGTGILHQASTLDPNNKTHTNELTTVQFPKRCHASLRGTGRRTLGNLELELSVISFDAQVDPLPGSEKEVGLDRREDSHTHPRKSHRSTDYDDENSHRDRRNWKNGTDSYSNRHHSHSKDGSSEKGCDHLMVIGPLARRAAFALRIHRMCDHQIPRDGIRDPLQSPSVSDGLRNVTTTVAEHPVTTWGCEIRKHTSRHLGVMLRNGALYRIRLCRAFDTSCEVFGDFVWCFGYRIKRTVLLWLVEKSVENREATIEVPVLTLQNCFEWKITAQTIKLFTLDEPLAIEQFRVSNPYGKKIHEMEELYKGLILPVAETLQSPPMRQMYDANNMSCSGILIRWLAVISPNELIRNSLTETLPTFLRKIVECDRMPEPLPVQKPRMRSPDPVQPPMNQPPRQNPSSGTGPSSHDMYSNEGLSKPKRRLRSHSNRSSNGSHDGTNNKKRRNWNNDSSRHFNARRKNSRSRQRNIDDAPDTKSRGDRRERQFRSPGDRYGREQ